MKRSTFFLGAGIVSLPLIYRRRYQTRFPLKAESNIEDDLSQSIYWQSLPIDWVKENEYYEKMVSQVQTYLEDHLRAGRINSHGQPLAYNVYSLDNPVASVVIVHGFNEFKEKYQELIYYLLQANIEVFIYDQRGHGQSRQAPLNTQISVQSFEEYQMDLSSFIDQVVIPQAHSSYRVLLSHSMGGAVSLNYLENHSQVFHRAIFNSPMFRINFGRLEETYVALLAQGMVGMGLGRVYIPGTRPLKLKGMDRLLDFAQLSRSIPRTAYATALNHHLHEPITQGGSYQWLQAAMDCDRRILDPAQLKEVDLPVMLIRAEKDQIIDNKGIYTVGEALENVNQWLVPEGEHENFMDLDSYFLPLVGEIIAFITQDNRRDRAIKF